MNEIALASGIKPVGISSVSGGDINESFRIKDINGQSFFLKLNADAAAPGMMASEANGLQALGQAGPFIVPKVIRVGNTGDLQYLLLEWIEKGSPSLRFWEGFGVSLAALHRIPRTAFGWESDNYIGTLPQANAPRQDWPGFYGQRRLLPLAKRLYETGKFTKSELSMFDKWVPTLSSHYDDVKPSLLHGDLWSGNFLIDPNGNPLLIDPAVYHGDREMDLALARLFGGFDARFFHAYDAEYPLLPGWQQRLKLAQLYPIMVHAVLFGGHYVRESLSIVKHYL